ncbi:MAG: aromatic ring-hydroxylating dioxygenase subunit alpha [Polyangiales bacterium]
MGGPRDSEDERRSGTRTPLQQGSLVFVAPLFTDGELAAVLAPFAQASPLPTRAYLDDEVFAFERTAIFDRGWRCVGRAHEVALPGAFFLASVGERELVVVRGADLVLRALHNVCRHRATAILDGPCGRVQQLECPYHGWSYELTGALRLAPNMPASFDRAAHALAPARVASWQGWIFVTLDATAPALADALGAVPAWLTEAPLALLERGDESRYEVRANWKLLVENFQECHHFERVHPALERLTPTKDACSHLGDGPWLGGSMPLVEGKETVSLTGARGMRPFITAEHRRRAVFDAMLFPSLLTSLQPDYLLTYRLDPLGPARTRVVAEVFFHPAAPKSAFADVVEFWARVNEEDRRICERQQAGVRSRAPFAPLYSTVEDGVHAFDRLVARCYAGDSPAARSAR